MKRAIVIIAAFWMLVMGAIAASAAPQPSLTPAVSLKHAPTQVRLSTAIQADAATAAIKPFSGKATLQLPNGQHAPHPPLAIPNR